MLVSIIITNYNYGRYVKEAINSALSQTYNQIELIIIDDGSTDFSRDIIEEYSDQATLYFKENTGQTPTIIYGIERCNGELVMILDADDALLPTAVKKCVNAFLNHNVVDVYFRLKKMDAQSTDINDCTPNQILKGRAPIEDIETWGFYPTAPQSGHMYKTSFLKLMLPYPNNLLSEEQYLPPFDAYIACNSLFHGGVYFIDEILGRYRVHDSNMSSMRNNFSEKKLRQSFMEIFVREQITTTEAAKVNIHLKPDRAINYPMIAKYRILSYRIYNDGHPITSDSLLNLYFRAVKGCFKYPYSTFIERIKNFISITALFLLPKKALNYIVKTKVIK